MGIKVTQSLGSGPEGSFVRVADDFVVPVPYEAEIDEERFPFIVKMRVGADQGRLACTALSFERREGGPPISGADLRVPLAGFIRHSATLAALRRSKSNPGAWSFLEEPDLDAFYAKRRQEPHVRRRKVSADRLERVAKVYREAVSARDRKPSVRVAEDLGVSRSHAGRLIQRAREEGYLRPTRRGKAGEEEEE